MCYTYGSILKMGKKIGDSVKKIEKKYSLNRALLLIMMVGYVAFLFLILIMDWYLISNSREQRQQREIAALNSYISKVQEAMERNRIVLYNIYAEDGNYEALGKSGSELSDYNAAYALNDSLSKRMLFEENISGFFIFYDNHRKTWYKFNDKFVGTEYIDDLKQNCLNLISSDAKRGWEAIAIDNHVYISVFHQRGRAAICTVYSLENIEEEFRESMGRDVSVIVTDRNLVLKNKALADELKLSERTANSSDIFHKRVGNYQVYSERIPNTDLWVSVTYPITLWDLFNVSQLLLLVLTVISVIAICALYLFVRTQVVNPLRSLRETMQLIRNGESKIIPDKDFVFDEYREVYHTLGSMVEALERQKMITYEEIIEKQKAQMQYLQLQLRPHFYLNGLKTLNALALEKQTDKMQELILNLSVHLRYLLQTETELVTLDKELDFVENYVNMQRYITGRKVVCEISKDDNIGDWPIPVLLIHTFIENSIKYAKLGNYVSPLCLDITIKKLVFEAESYLDIVIEDNGQGYSAELLEEINDEPRKACKSIGINNIKRRCRILYGDKAEFNFTNHIGAYSEIIIPKM